MAHYYQKLEELDLELRHYVNIRDYKAARACTSAIIELNAELRMLEDIFASI